MQPKASAVGARPAAGPVSLGVDEGTAESSTATELSSVLRPDPFHHEAVLYEGDAGFVAGCTSFIRDSLEAAEPILVVVVRWKIDLLREALGAEAESVLFADMTEVGRNPARIIPAWRDFATQYGKRGGRLRGIGEPIWAGRPADELAEASRHEALLNLAFTGVPMRLVCPYDIESLPADVIAHARRNHPVVSADGTCTESSAYAGVATLTAPFDEPLTPAPVHARRMRLHAENLAMLRRFVFATADSYGLDLNRSEDLVFAVNEIATNSVRHGGGAGSVLLWHDDHAVVCEIRDRGRIDEPLAGRIRPEPGQESGLGLWLVNQLCDLVQVRSLPSGGVVRLRMKRA